MSQKINFGIGEECSTWTHHSDDQARNGIVNKLPLTQPMIDALTPEVLTDARTRILSRLASSRYQYSAANEYTQPDLLLGRSGQFDNQVITALVKDKDGKQRHCYAKGFDIAYAIVMFTNYEIQLPYADVHNIDPALIREPHWDGEEMPEMLTIDDLVDTEKKSIAGILTVEHYVAYNDEGNIRQDPTLDEDLFSVLYSSLIAAEKMREKIEG
ncbi:hypothetical protein N24_1786 [Corynebacterium suranareeae]|uniref:Uncharacterized protein n=1 Tax=Corynebacterium suranareeae TaxID=2506452 RepID=A0A169RXW5_9CORY|nr:hypothetical protein [Corynebacterium suranareeae]BAU96048.1 hypothetical protein N24_1786 [Corynebacterium suranareeae]